MRPGKLWRLARANLTRELGALAVSASGVALHYANNFQGVSSTAENAGGRLSVGRASRIRPAYGAAS